MHDAGDCQLALESCPSALGISVVCSCLASSHVLTLNIKLLYRCFHAALNTNLAHAQTFQGTLTLLARGVLLGAGTGCVGGESAGAAPGAGFLALAPVSREVSAPTCGTWPAQGQEMWHWESLNAQCPDTWRGPRTWNLEANPGMSWEAGHVGQQSAGHPSWGSDPPQPIGPGSLLWGSHPLPGEEQPTRRSHPLRVNLGGPKWSRQRPPRPAPWRRAKPTPPANAVAA